MLRYPTYGYRKPITQLLQRMGYAVGSKRVARLMKATNLPIAVKRVCQTTTSLDAPGPWGNRVETLEVSRCDQVWVGDITDVRLKSKFVSVDLLMDVFTRMIRGWKPISYQQYLSKVSYISTLTHHGIEISGVSRRGHPWENGYAERLIRTLKEEEVYLNDSQNIIEAREHIGHFIEQVSHQKRLHSETLGYLTPMEFERQTLIQFAKLWSEETVALHFIEDVHVRQG